MLEWPWSLRRAARKRANHAMTKCAEGPTVPADSTTKRRKPEVTHRCMGTKLPYSRHFSRSWVWTWLPSLPSGVSIKHRTSTCTSRASGLRKWMSAVRNGCRGGCLSLLALVGPHFSLDFAAQSLLYVRMHATRATVLRKHVSYAIAPLDGSPLMTDCGVTAKSVQRMAARRISP